MYKKSAENARRGEEKEGKICHRFIIEIRAGSSSIEFEIPKRMRRRGPK